MPLLDSIILLKDILGSGFMPVLESIVLFKGTYFVLLVLFLVLKIHGTYHRTNYSITLNPFPPAGLTEQEHTRLRRTLLDLSLRTGLPSPRVNLVETDTAYAAMGGPPLTPHLFLSIGAVRKLTPDQLHTVLAHEYAHAVNNDMRPIGILNALISSAYMLAVVTLFLLPLTGSMWQVSAGVLQWTMLFWVIYFSLQVWLSVYAHKIEYRSDRQAAEWTGKPEDLIAALEMMEAQPEILAQRRAAATLPLAFMEPLFSSHPLLEDRARALGVKR